jgi:hypothetical protein
LPPWCGARLVQLKVARISEFSPLTMLAIKFRINLATSRGNLMRTLIAPKHGEHAPSKGALPASV